ncbi:hypothetical protein BCY91_05555 [Pelobium manganitolerans]|uniref:Uncharacterized protein n=1 Tax=Pelobium manganitolerans TaxID=1842495 RepID=A0A419S671_9SPHI|nr:hypothetical protein BCY91_05555 [Pelobium manganitolerans]
MKNLKIHISILLLFFLGFFLMPNQSYACSKKSTQTEQSSCSKDKSKKSKHSSCKGKSCKKRKDSNGCGGNCKHSSCRCAASTTSLSLPLVIEFKAKNPLAAGKKKKFGFKEAYYSSGFFSIWLPPKIS